MKLLNLIDQGLDEMAAGTHAGFAPRLAATMVVGLTALAFLPWQVCAAWCAVETLVESVSWFVTREQFLGRPVGWGPRLGHLGCLVAGVAAWVILGLLFWRIGSGAGAVSAVAIWLALMGFAQVYAYQSRVGYLLAGVIPASR